MARKSPLVLPEIPAKPETGRDRAGASRTNCVGQAGEFFFQVRFHLRRLFSSLSIYRNIPSLQLAMVVVAVFEMGEGWRVFLVDSPL